MSAGSGGLPPPLQRIVSGGQTGADRAALDWAIRRGVEHGGWCPRGRLAEDGILDRRYRLRETESDSYVQRTRRNVEDSDGTLVLNLGALDGGTLETVRYAEALGKPCLLIALDAGIGPDDPARALQWLRQWGIAALNVAGPRESKRPGIYRLTLDFLDRLAPRPSRAKR